MVEYIKITSERLKVLLADKQTIPQIENATHTKIEIDRKTEQIEIYEKKDTPDPLGTWRARDVIKAIGRGFVKETAFRLLDEEAVLIIIDLNEYAHKKKNALERIKGRIIGTEGKSKQRIAEITDTDIVVYGKTVSIIGKLENAELAARAITMLCEGAMHNTVFRMLGREAGAL
ncbi:TPA: RNA-processing protein [archaeon]|uniref:RNA-processing protein n=1 Tax=Candidatus Naiadarchaeum limnaeum TaxID=2756139 RepID=A0A832UMT7_9ARCH|nr:RNA-processing protein [Candidatus Naiadarchaeum limnaeum]